eukprot:31556-Pelagococcus_subviridis.AAC.19
MKGIAVGLQKGHVVSKHELAARPARRKGVRFPTTNFARRLGKRVKMIRELVRDVVGNAPYEKRLMELLKVGRDKRALKLAKRKPWQHSTRKASRMVSTVWVA